MPQLVCAIENYRSRAQAVRCGEICKSLVEDALVGVGPAVHGLPYETVLGRNRQAEVGGDHPQARRPTRPVPPDIRTATLAERSGRPVRRFEPLGKTGDVETVIHAQAPSARNRPWSRRLCGRASFGFRFSQPVAVIDAFAFLTPQGSGLDFSVNADNDQPWFHRRGVEGRGATYLDRLLPAEDNG